MAKNIEMNVLEDGGQYEILYPKTIPDQVVNLLNDNTKTYIGLTTQATPDDAFRQLYLMNILGDKCSFKLKLVTSITQTPLVNIPVACSSFVDAQGNPVSSPLYTDDNGEIDTFFKGGNVTLSVTGFADLQDWSQVYQVDNGEQYSYVVSLTAVDFAKYTSTRNIMFSGNVNSIDVCCVGGGGGGGSNGGGGGGGYCTVQENVPIEIFTNYPISIGAGGSGAVLVLGEGTTISAKPGGTTTFLGVSANGGQFGTTGLGSSTGGIGNGNGGYVNSSYSGVTGVNATAGTVPGYSSFSDTVLYGGGGGARNDNDMAEGGWYVSAQGAGYGGNPSANYNERHGQSGFGGGGSAYRLGRGDTAAGNGGSGCVAIRIHLKTT